jgi:hypothetical protein
MKKDCSQQGTEDQFQIAEQQTLKSKKFLESMDSMGLSIRIPKKEMEIALSLSNHAKSSSLLGESVDC